MARATDAADVYRAAPEPRHDFGLLLACEAKPRHRGRRMLAACEAVMMGGSVTGTGQQLPQRDAFSHTRGQLIMLMLMTMDKGDRFPGRASSE